jgi:hypothetical protein
MEDSMKNINMLTQYNASSEGKLKLTNIDLEIDPLMRQINRIKNNCCPEVLVIGYIICLQIVDDLDYNRFLLKSILKRVFHLDCVEACNGQKAIELISILSEGDCCNKIKLIIMDIEMPVKNGLEVRISSKIITGHIGIKEVQTKTWELTIACEPHPNRWFHCIHGHEDSMH